MARDAGDEQRVRQAQAQERRQAKQQEQDFRAVMGTREGRAVLWGVLAEARVFHPSYVAGDPYATAFREGERGGGLKLIGLMQRLTPADYITMTQEAQAKGVASTEPATDTDTEDHDG